MQDFPSSEGPEEKIVSSQTTHVGLAPGIRTWPSSGQPQPTFSVQISSSGQSHYVSEPLLDKELIVEPQTLQETTSSTVKITAFGLAQTHFKLVAFHFILLLIHSHCPGILELTPLAFLVESQVIH